MILADTLPSGLLKQKLTEVKLFSELDRYLLDLFPEELFLFRVGLSRDDYIVTHSDDSC